LDASEIFILDTIQDKNSPIAQGMNIGESGRPAASQPQPSTSRVSVASSRISPSPTAHTSLTVQQMIDEEEREHELQEVLDRGGDIDSRPKAAKRVAKKSEAEELLQKKRKLQIDLLQIEYYNKQLTALDLERKLKLQPSVYTQDLFSSVVFDTFSVDRTDDQNCSD
jgi:hypothetical protein